MLHHLTGTTSIQFRQENARAVLFARAFQLGSHGLHHLARKVTEECHVSTEQGRLRPREPLAAPPRRLKRKSWLDLSLTAARSHTGSHTLAPNPMWRKPHSSTVQHVEIRFGRECREWPSGEAEEACKTMLREFSDGESLVIATDGSFTGECNRAGWGFAVYQGDRKIAEDCGSHKLYTSSTRMEVEAVNRALKWLSLHHPNHSSVIIATDSVALLSKIKSGWVPENWSEPCEVPVMGRITWIYVPGHSGVTINEEADRLAAASEVPASLPLYSSDVDLLGKHLGKTTTINLLSNSSEGLRLQELNIAHGASARSRRKGPDRCRYNQLITGNVSRSTLLLQLRCGEMGKRISATQVHPR